MLANLHPGRIAVAPLDIRQRRMLVDQTAAATERRFLTWEATKKLVRLMAVRGVVFASRRRLAGLLDVSLRTLVFDHIQSLPGVRTCHTWLIFDEFEPEHR